MEYNDRNSRKKKNEYLIEYARRRKQTTSDRDGASELLDFLESIVSIFDFVDVITNIGRRTSSSISDFIYSIVNRFTKTGKNYETSLISALTNILSPIEYLMDQYSEFVYGYDYDQKLFVTRIYWWLHSKIGHLSKVIWNRVMQFFATEDTVKKNETKDADSSQISSHFSSFSIQMLALSLVLILWRLLYLRWRYMPEVSTYEDPSLDTHIEQMYIGPISKKEHDNEVRRFYQHRYQHRSYIKPELRQDFLSYFPSVQERRSYLHFGRNPSIPRGIAPVDERNVTLF